MQINNAIILASNLAAAGSASVWKGGKGLFMGEGTWNSGSAVLETLSPNGTWIPVKNPAGTAVSLSANGCLYFELCSGQIRMNISGSPSALYVYAIGMHQ